MSISQVDRSMSTPQRDQSIQLPSKRPSRELLAVVLAAWSLFLSTTTLRTFLPSASTTAFDKFLQEERSVFGSATTSEEETNLQNFFDLGDGTDLIAPEGSEALELIRALNVTSPYSDTAYLHHCNVTALNETSFLRFLNNALSLSSADKWAEILEANVSNIHSEIVLQGLELYSRGMGVCDYSEYKPTVPASPVQRNQIASLVRGIANPPPGEARIVFSISVFDDFPHLERLIQDIYLPQHLIILHVERRASPSFIEQLQTLAERYKNNVLILKYGSITYPSESVSNVFLQIMRLVTIDLQLWYDYFITLSASSYPLWGAHEMARHLYADEKHVRIGRMIYGSGKRLCRQFASGAGILLSSGMAKKRHFMLHYFARDLASAEGLPKIEDFLPKDIGICSKKTNSGNTAAYDRAAVQALLTSPSAMDLLSRFKQAGSCCSEEVSWGATLAAIGRDSDVEKTGMMWQGWPCGRGVMHNTVFKANETDFCVSVVDQGYYNSDENKDKRPVARTIRGYVALEQEMKEAQSRGHLFIRKFGSDDTYWVDWIQSNLHNKSALLISNE